MLQSLPLSMIFVHAIYSNRSGRTHLIFPRLLLFSRKQHRLLIAHFRRRRRFDRREASRCPFSQSVSQSGRRARSVHGFRLRVRTLRRPLRLVLWLGSVGFNPITFEKLAGSRSNVAIPSSLFSLDPLLASYRFFLLSFALPESGT